MFGDKYLWFVAITVCLGSLTVCAASRENEKALLHEAVVECLKEHNLTKEETATLREDAPDDYYCVVSCVLKKTERFDKDGLANIEKISEDIKKHSRNEEKLTKTMNGLKECSKINNEEVSDGDKGCERAKLFLECMEEQIKHKINHFLNLDECHHHHHHHHV